MTGEVRWRQDWGTPAREPALDPGRPLIDPHHHFWPDRAAGTVPAGPYLAADLTADLAGHRVVATVAIEAHAAYHQAGPPELAPVGETEFLARQAKALAAVSGAPRLGGIVAHADLRLGDRVAQVLEAHRQAAGGLLRGVRQMAAYAANGPNYSPVAGDLYADPSFRQGVRRLGEAGLVCDVWHFHTQQADFAALARACPQTTFVVDHYGTPLGVGGYAGRQGEVAAEWRRELPELADLPNVFVKASGFCMSLTGSPWREDPNQPTSDQIADAAAPWFAELMAQFGPRRCMFASNFPVDKTSVAYTVLWNAYKKLAAKLSDEEADALCRGTAAKVYRIEQGDVG
jgi:predicted TIM-barrel fold metal-dependent hydrolase